MSRVPPTPVEVLVDGSWLRGTVRTCDVTADGESCTAVVSWGGPVAAGTGRVGPARLRRRAGPPRGPVAPEDRTCAPARARTTCCDPTLTATGRDVPPQG